MGEADEIKKITELLYQHNLELAVKNKTLSLLEKLYQISVLELKPEVLAQDVVNTIRVDLDFEITGIFTFDVTTDSLTPLAFSKADRIKGIFEKLHISLENIKILEAGKHDFLKQAIYDKNGGARNNLKEVWGELISPEGFQTIDSESNIKTVLLYPLKIENKVFGAIFLGFNREYEVLSTFEKECSLPLSIFQGAEND